MRLARPFRFGIGEGALQGPSRERGRSSGYRRVPTRGGGGRRTQIFRSSATSPRSAICGRRRYLVGITQEDFLFEVQLPNTIPGGGRLRFIVNSDIENQGRSVRIHSILGGARALDEHRLKCLPGGLPHAAACPIAAAKCAGKRNGHARFVPRRPRQPFRRRPPAPARAPGSARTARTGPKRSIVLSAHELVDLLSVPRR